MLVHERVVCPRSAVRFDIGWRDGGGQMSRHVRKKWFLITRYNRVLAQGTRIGCRSILNMADFQAKPSFDSALLASLHLWHERLAQVHVGGIRNMA